MDGLLDRALILHLVAYRDADLMVSMLAEGRGRLDASAPAGRKSRTRYQAGLDKYCVLELELATDRRGRHRIRSSRLVDPLEGLRSDVERLAAAELVCEVARATAPEGPEGGVLFAPVLALLRLLAAVDRGRVGPVTWGGLLWVLATQGFVPRDCRCARCDASPAPGQDLLFSLSSSSLRCEAHALDPGAMHRLSPGARALADAATSGSLRPLAQGEAADGDLRLMARYAEIRVHEVLPRVPRSLEFFRQVVG
ncbi:MAG: DNA repair protein RecO C-terminal domain-containing protein [Deltaproteobacteria bacterium]|nr:DNA repair protein RecO C-terminal domain-containing protein [Deltaproteobacteria bacterium]